MDSYRLNHLSQQLLLRVKMQEDTSQIRSELANIQFSTLQNELIFDETKKAFWINIYNAYFLILRKEYTIQKPDIYRKKLILIAGKSFSLDTIEHGILRRYHYKRSLGFFKNIFTSKLIKQLAVNKIDYRIHFALNCGAKSCPPIAFYKYSNLDAQLDIATQSFLEGESDFYDDKKELHTTTLFKWYLADFGRYKGIKKIYKVQLNKDITDYTIKFKKYSWEESLDNFAA